MPALFTFNVRERPVIDGFLRSLVPDLRSLRADAKFQILFFGLQRPGRQPAHFLSKLGRRAVNGRETRDCELAGIRSGVTGVSVLLRIEPRFYFDVTGRDA